MCKLRNQFDQSSILPETWLLKPVEASVSLKTAVFKDLPIFSSWIDNINMDLLEIGLSVVDWIGLVQDRYRWRALVNSVMNFRVP
jgi:hypothetical protein